MRWSQVLFHPDGQIEWGYTPMVERMGVKGERGGEGEERETWQSNMPLVSVCSRHVAPVGSWKANTLEAITEGLS